MFNSVLPLEIRYSNKCKYAIRMSYTIVRQTTTVLYFFPLT